MENVKERVRQFLAGKLAQGRPIDTSDDTPLVASDLLDSTAFVTQKRQVPHGYAG